MLLWHGSRLTNWVGILSQGLRIAPPEAPVTGYMFGKGVYFADMVSKSANYCFASRDSPTAVLLLCDVALGKQHELISSQYEAAERSKARGKQSTYGVGKTCPDPSSHATLPPDITVPSSHATLPPDITVPTGKAGPNTITVPTGKAGPNTYLTDSIDRIKEEGGGKRSELLYNEFIVYDTSQIRAKYIVVVDFHHL